MTAAEICRQIRRMEVLDLTDRVECLHVWLWGEPMTKETRAAALALLRQRAQGEEEPPCLACLCGAALQHERAEHDAALARVAELERDLALNAQLLARQCDLAREAELERDYLLAALDDSEKRRSPAGEPAPE